jgi:hypothetical protein
MDPAEWRDFRSFSWLPTPPALAAAAIDVMGDT